MTLFEGKIGVKYIIKEIDLDEDVKRRLEILGMTRESVVSVINRKNHGALIINIRGTRFAIGKDFAKGIKVGGVYSE